MILNVFWMYFVTHFWFTAKHVYQLPRSLISYSSEVNKRPRILNAINMIVTTRLNNLFYLCSLTVTTTMFLYEVGTIKRFMYIISFTDIVNR